MDYMQRNGSRTMMVNKADLIKKIKENKAAHIKAYTKAVIAYKKEALRQLAELTKNAKAGAMRIQLNLTTPIDNSKAYDATLEMFEWDVNGEVELTQKEFNEYVRDETAIAQQAMLSNSMYLG